MRSEQSLNDCVLRENNPPAAVLLGPIDVNQPLYVEGEGRRIGRLTVPASLVARMRTSACIEVQASVAARVEFLLRDYAYLGERPEWLADQIAPLKSLHGNEAIAAWQRWRMRDNFRSCSRPWRSSTTTHRTGVPTGRTLEGGRPARSCTLRTCR